MRLKSKTHRKTKRASKKKGLYPVLFVIESLKEYHHKLVQQEVDSLSELGLVNQSFGKVMDQADDFRDKLQEFKQTFEDINQVSGSFAEVREKIVQTVTQAQVGVEALENKSVQMKTDFDEMEVIFEDLQEAVEKIKKCMSSILSIADQTNILAMNASIEAARAGQAGKGFAIVATEVKTLADEIKGLAEEVHTGLGGVERGSERLSSSIDTSKQVLEQNLQHVDETHALFDQIVQAADGSISVQNEISGAIERSRASLQVLYSFFDKLKGRYQEVVEHIRRASKLGTMKSSMFEDIDNLMAQIPPIIKEEAPENF